MADLKISALSAGSSLAGTEVAPFVQSSATVKVTATQIQTYVLSSYAGASSITTLGTVGTGTWQGTAVVTTYGGTGLTSYTAGDLPYYASGTALSKLAIGGSTAILTSSGTAPQWSTNATVAGTLQGTGISSATAEVGFRGIPQNSQSAAYTTVAADNGKHIFHPASDANARTFTIDSNANVAYPIGASITFINRSANAVTIAITSDTLTLSPAGTTGSRTLAQYGMATAIKIGTTEWMISGTGLT